MDEEITAIKKNDTWKLTPLPKGYKSYRCKIGVQGEEECKGRDREAQGKTSGKRLQSESRDRLQ